ncbi:MAG TPA: hypothetical protein VGV07_12705 [Devosia sp.]|jgi:hypothetical protein|nr:hypothetical protein [Devosia sp.]HEV2516105.1 hypothetical protein [Devosia sp.]
MPRDKVRTALEGDIFVSSLLARPVWVRLAGVVGVLAALWLLIAWAVSLP